MGELINLRDWQADKKRRAIQASVDKINNAIKGVQEFLKDANSRRKSVANSPATRKRNDFDRLDFIFDDESDQTKT